MEFTQHEVKLGRKVTIAIAGSRGIPNRFGGFEQNTADLAEFISKEKFSLYVFCESRLKRSRVSIPWVRLVYFPVIDSFRRVSSIVYDAMSLTWCAFRDVDIVYLLGYSAAPFCLIPRLFGKVTLINVDGFEWKRRSYNKLERFLLKRLEHLATKSANYLICDSKAVQDYYDRRYSARTKFIPHISPLIDYANPSLLNMFGLASQSYYLAVARLDPENNVDMIIDGFVMSNTSRKLVVVGYVADKKFGQMLARKRDGRVVFLGPIWDRSVLAALRLNCFVHIHGHEVGGTNPSLLEALGCSNAILAIDVSFNREVAGDAALYFSDSKELAGLISALESQESMVKRMRIVARERAEKKYSKDLVIGAYTEFFEQLTETSDNRLGMR